MLLLHLFENSLAGGQCHRRTLSLDSSLLAYLRHTLFHIDCKLELIASLLGIFALEFLLLETLVGCPSLKCIFKQLISVIIIGQE